MKTKWKQLKQAIKNPPPDRLAKVEWQSHLLQALGITFVSLVLIYKGLWYIIFAFIFAIGINYSQGMNAYRKWKNIRSFMPEEKPEDYIKDISPTRKRGKIITYVFGSKAKWLSLFLSVFTSWVIFGFDNHWLFNSLVYPPVTIVLFLIIYFVGFYEAAKPVYKMEVKK